MRGKILILTISLILILSLTVWGANKPVDYNMIKKVESLDTICYTGEILPIKYLRIQESKIKYLFSDDTVGYTYYDYQFNAPQHRQIASDSSGTLHFTWMDLIGPDDSYYRFIDYNARYANGTRLTPGGVHITPDSVRGGYGCLDILPDNREVLCYHRPYDDDWGSTVSIEDSIPGSGQFNHFDIPDSVAGKDTKGEWPTVASSKVKNGDTSYVHITHENGRTACGYKKELGYVRCFEMSTNRDTLICQSPGWDSPLFIPKDAKLVPNKVPFMYAIAQLGSGVIVTSPVSQKVCIAWLQYTSSSYTSKNEVMYLESSNNGDDWMAAGNMGTPVQLTNYGASGFVDRAYCDIAAVYDYNDELHIIWTTFTAENLNDVTLWHWSASTGIRKVASANASSAVDPGAWNLLIAKFTLGVGSDPSDSAYNYLYVNYTKFKQDDISAGGYANGDICVKASSNGGLTWGQEINLTNTNSDGCLPGDCESEHWSSIAEKVDSFLYIQYIYDLDAGGIPYDEGTYTLNPVRFLKYPRFLVTPLAALNFTPTQMIDPVRWAKNNQTASDSLIVDNEWGTAALYVQIDGPSWVSIYPSNFNIAEGGLPQKVSLTFSGGGFADTFLVDSLRIISNNDTSGEVYSDTDWVKIQFVVTDSFYYPEFYVVNNGTIATSVSNVGNLAHQEDSAGMFFDRRGYLYDFSLVMCINIPGYGEKGATWFSSRKDFLPLSHVQVTDCSGLRSTCVKSAFTPISWMLGPPLNWFWSWYALEERSIFFMKPVNPPANPVHYERAILKYTKLYKSQPPPWWNYVTPEPPTLPDAYLGFLADWDVPYPSGTPNIGGFDSTSNLIWISGEPGTYTSLCGAILFLYCTDDQDTIWAPFSARILNNTTQIDPFDGPEDDSLYKYMATPGWSIESDSAQDKSILLSAIHLQNPDTSTVVTLKYALLITDQGKADLDTLANQFRRVKCGDANIDGKVSVSDVVYLINYLFKGGPEPWLYYSDCNGDSIVSVSDVVYEINYLFKGGPAPKCDCCKL